MKSLTWLLQSMLKDMSVRCGTDTQRDLITLISRVENEGPSFFTISLSDFCSDFEKSLDQGSVDRDSFRSFEKVKGGRIPKFLSGIVGLVFDASTGTLMAEPNIDAIISVRQFCLMAKKVKVECSEERKASANKRFITIERELKNLLFVPQRNSENQITGYQGIPAICPELWDEATTLHQQFLDVSDQLWGRTINALAQRVEEGSLIPKQGPGANSDRVQGNLKYSFANWPKRLEALYPFANYGVVNHGWLEDSLQNLTFLDPDLDYPVKVVQVPKTLKGPRVIAMETAAVQYVQQAVLHSLVDLIEEDPLLRGRINFRDQSLNAKDALRSSKNGRMATLDLSDASDRVHASWVHEMFIQRKYDQENDAYHFHDFFSIVDALRTPRAELEGDINITLSKFASMGSALCFPIMAMFLMTTLVVAWHREKKSTVTVSSVARAIKSFRVYGDDIICPVRMVPTVIETIGLFGLKVNTKKSFWTGKFRESCGTDAYDGVDVTPVYIRELLPDNRYDVQKLPSMVALANQLYLKGWWQTAAYVRCEAVRLFGPIPHVGDDAPCLGWVSLDKRYTFERWSQDHQAPLVKGFCVSPKRTMQVIPDHAKLLKALLAKPGDEEKRYSLSLDGLVGSVLDFSSSDPHHLERYTRPRHVNIKRRWVRPY